MAGAIACARCAKTVPLSTQRLCPYCHRIFHEACCDLREITGARVDGYLLGMCLTCSGSQRLSDLMNPPAGWQFARPRGGNP